jgi:hypothetical protein
MFELGMSLNSVLLSLSALVLSVLFLLSVFTLPVINVHMYTQSRLIMAHTISHNAPNSLKTALLKHLQVQQQRKEIKNIITAKLIYAPVTALLIPRGISILKSKTV